MNLNNYTIKSQEAIQAAANLARDGRQQSVENAHLLKALLTLEESVVPFLLKKLGTNVPLIEQKTDELLSSLPRVEGASGGQFLSQDLNRTMDAANRLAGKSGDEFISMEHLLLGMLEGNSRAASMLLLP